MKESHIKRYRPYDYEAREAFTEQELNYERLEQAIMIGQQKLERFKEEEKYKRYDEWDEILKIRKIPEGCSKFEERKIELYNNFRRLLGCLFFKPEYAKYTNANIELMRMFPQAVLFLIYIALFIFGIYGCIYSYHHISNFAIGIIIFLCFTFSFIFRIAFLELSNTNNEKIIENAFTNTIAVAGLIAAIIPIAMEYHKPKEESHIFQSSDSAYTFNMDQIAYIDTKSNEEGEYTIYFSGGLTVSVPQQVYDEVCATMK